MRTTHLLFLSFAFILLADGGIVTATDTDATPNTTGNATNTTVQHHRSHRRILADTSVDGGQDEFENTDDVTMESSTAGGIVIGIESSSTGIAGTDIQSSSTAGLILLSSSSTGSYYGKSQISRVTFLLRILWSTISVELSTYETRLKQDLFSTLGIVSSRIAQVVFSMAEEVEITSHRRRALLAATSGTKVSFVILPSVQARDPTPMQITDSILQAASNSSSPFHTGVITGTIEGNVTAATEEVEVCQDGSVATVCPLVVSDESSAKAWPLSGDLSQWWQILVLVLVATLVVGSTVCCLWYLFICCRRETRGGNHIRSAKGMERAGDEYADYSNGRKGDNTDLHSTDPYRPTKLIYVNAPSPGIDPTTPWKPSPAGKGRKLAFGKNSTPFATGAARSISPPSSAQQKRERVDSLTDSTEERDRIIADERERQLRKEQAEDDEWERLQQERRYKLSERERAEYHTDRSPSRRNLAQEFHVSHPPSYQPQPGQIYLPSSHFDTNHSPSRDRSPIRQDHRLQSPHGSLPNFSTPPRRPDVLPPLRLGGQQRMMLQSPLTITFTPSDSTGQVPITGLFTFEQPHHQQQQHHLALRGTAIHPSDVHHTPSPQRHEYQRKPLPPAWHKSPFDFTVPE